MAEHSPPSNPPSACERVFAIAELAEKIFLDLDFFTVIGNVQRTCRQWHAVVQDSTPLQEFLFFKPITTTLVWPYYKNAEDFDFEMYFAESENGQRAVLVLEHPLISLAQDFGNFDDARETRLLHPSVRFPEASWRKQLVSQPPIGRLHRWSDYQDCGWSDRQTSGNSTPVDLVRRNDTRASEHDSMTTDRCLNEHEPEHKAVTMSDFDKIFPLDWSRENCHDKCWEILDEGSFEMYEWGASQILFWLKDNVVREDKELLKWVRTDARDYRLLERLEKLKLLEGSSDEATRDLSSTMWEGLGQDIDAAREYTLQKPLLRVTSSKTCKSDHVDPRALEPSIGDDADRLGRRSM